MSRNMGSHSLGFALGAVAHLRSASLVRCQSGKEERTHVCTSVVGRLLPLSTTQASVI
jgi:hypothetical protein